MGAFKRLRATLAKRTFEQTVWAIAGIVVALVLATGVLADTSGATSSSSSSTASSSDSTPTTTPLGCAVGNITCTNQELASLACHTSITTGWRINQYPDPDVSDIYAPDYIEYDTPSGTPAAMMVFQRGSKRGLLSISITCPYSYRSNNIEIAGPDYGRILTQAGTSADLPPQLRY
jgi:hypothetical protein